MPPCAIPADIPQKHRSSGLELLADEAESEHPAPESVFFVVSLLRNRASVLKVFGKLAHSEAQLNVSLELSAMNTALFAVMRLIELEESELDCAFCECGMEVEHVIAAHVVVGISAEIRVVSLVPDVGELVHSAGFFSVEPSEEDGVNGSAKFLVSGHDVCEVSESFCGMVAESDVNVNPATS